MTPPLPTLVLLLLLAASSASAAGFTCAKPSTCHPAIGYVVPNATTYEKLISRFHPTTLHDLLAANQLASDTAARQAIPARTTLSIPFRCLCTGNGVGQSDLYTVQTGPGNDDLEVVPANNILAADFSEQLIHAARLPCSCDKVDGSDVMHFAYIVPSGDNTLEIAARYGVPESTLLRINNITIHTSIRRGQILDIPLQGTGTWSRLHCISGYRKRSLLVKPPKVPQPKLTPPQPKLTPSQINAAGKKADAFTKALKQYLVPVFTVILVAIILSWTFGTFYYWRSAVNSMSSGTTAVVMQFDYSELDRARHRFSEESKIGEGNFGEVYNATYKDQEVAVKKLKPKGNTKDMHVELQTVSNTRHTNLVRLKSWCGRVRFIDATSWWKREIKVELLIVFEWIPNGNLESHLYKREQVLPWEKRYNIVNGIGSALRYLHHECNPCILHRDVKPENILLDDHFNAKLADFGLSLITSKNRAAVVTKSEGSNGYMDPQLQKDGNVEFNRKSDVYSFGMVLLEIACIIAVENNAKNKRQNPGRKSREEIWELYSGSAERWVDAAADTKLGGVFDKNQMERVVVLGLKCSHPEETHRPSMEDAMKFLEDGQELPAATQGQDGCSASCSVNG